MSAGDRITTPRCLRPVRRYEFRTDRGPRGDLDPVCWRPAGHPGRRHLSRWAYLRELERRLRRDKGRPRRKGRSRRQGLAA